MARFACLVILLATCISFALAQQQRTECCEEYCYGSDSDIPQSQRFASKSVYQIARGVDMSRHSVIPSEYGRWCQFKRRDIFNSRAKLIVPINPPLLCRLPAHQVLDVGQTWSATSLSQRHAEA